MRSESRVGAKKIDVAAKMSAYMGVTRLLSAESGPLRRFGARVALPAPVGMAPSEPALGGSRDGGSSTKSGSAYASG